MIISAVFPAPTSWASSTAGSLIIRATAATWCGAGPERQGQAGQRQLGVVVAAQHQAVEPVVVGAGQRGGAGRVLPRPVREPLGQLGGLLLRGQRRVGVQDRTVLAMRRR